MEKLSQADIDKLLSEWFTKEEIAWVQRGIDDVNNWRVYNEEDMQKFVEKNIFAKYKKVNV